MRSLSTLRCRLVPMVAAHASEMFHVLGDPAIYEFENEPPVSEEWLTRRYEFLEKRSSPDESEQWLNWVVELPSGELAGYAQATVLASGISYVAYELNSRFWRQGIGGSAVKAVLEELRASYAVHTAVAVLKTMNFRSMGLLKSLGFVQAKESQAAEFEPEADESAMTKLLIAPPCIDRD